jgi:hypothetical protein
MTSSPILSIVVTVVSDTAQPADLRHLESCLEALELQTSPPSLEILVTCESNLPGIEKLQQRFSTVSFICVDRLRTAAQEPSREHHDILRGIGFRRARGILIASLEDHDRPDPQWCAQLVKEHVRPYAAIGGAIENGIDRLMNWAVYFCDFGRYQNPLPAGPSTSASDANVCYKREALEFVREAWDQSYNETRVHAALGARGALIALSPDVIVYQHRLNLRLRAVLLERYVWARSYAAVRVAGARFLSRFVLLALCPVLPPVLVIRQFMTVLRKRRNRGAFLRALPLTFLLDMVWAYGEFVGYLTGRAMSSFPIAKNEVQI